MKRTLLLLAVALVAQGVVHATPATATAKAEMRAPVPAHTPRLDPEFAALFAQAELPSAVAAYDRGDYQQALADFRELAAQGVAGAEFNLGLMDAKGQGVTQSYAEALKWWHLAAAQGYVWADYNLGLLFLMDFDSQDSTKQIRSYLREAASSGDAEVSKKAIRLLEVLNATPRNSVGNEDCRLALLRDALGKGRGILAAQEVLYVNRFAQSLGYNNLQTLFAIDGQQDGMLVALKYCRAGTSLATALDIFALSNGY